MPIIDAASAYKHITAKRPEYDALWDYYIGDHDLKYSTDRLDQVFQNLNTRFIQNWCSVVIDAAMDRLNLARWQVGESDEASGALNALHVSTELNLDSDDAHLGALVFGEAMIHCWRDEGGPVEAYYIDPRWAHIEYDPAKPRNKLWAAKLWTADNRYREIVYYPDRLEYYVTNKEIDQITSATEMAKTFVPADPMTWAEVPYENAIAENPYDTVPIFHLRRDRLTVQSELANVLGPQDAINKLLADMMVTAEFAAFPQRWIITDAETRDLKNSPYEIWSIPASEGMGQQTTVGQFPAANLGVYLEAMDKLAYSIAIITRTPKHYFFAQGGVPSGEALIAMEAPLNKKCSRYIERFTAVWRRVGAFMLRLAGTEVTPLEVTPLFDRPETVQPRTRAEIRQINASAGVPITTTLRVEEGWSDSQIDAMLDDQRKMREATASVGEQLLRGFETQLGGGG